jgi:hypothetical protein
MNAKLVFQLSLFGLGMAFGTVFFISAAVEPLCWLFVFVICAGVIGIQQTPKPFFHGIAISVVNSIWITAVHIAFYTRYIAAHPREAEMMRSAPMSPRLTMALVGPLIGVASGIVLGVLAMIAARLLRPKEPSAEATS